MGRFNLSKGERFSFAKDQCLNNLTVTLGWGSGADLDASTFLVGEDGVIEDDANFVYYNSAKRSEDFNREKFGNKNAWMKATRPMSADGSVLGSIDDREGGSAEKVSVDLSKVSPKVREIVFCASIFDEGKTFGNVDSPFISIVNDANGEELCRYTLDEQFSAETALVAGSLSVNASGDWEFKAEGKGLIGGLQALVELYAE
ncbi:MAG: TerD family protein [Marinilabiliaceae bacterium]